MDTELPSLCLHCGTEIPPQSGRGKPKKFCNDAHKSAYNRRIKAETKALQSPTPPPTKPSQPHPNQLIGSDGVDYSDPYKVMPPHLAVYMPVQSHENLTDKLAFEARISGSSHPSKPKSITKDFPI